jgi:acetyltransferase-like isoleucine patch superfamily enzyme
MTLYARLMGVDPALIEAGRESPPITDVLYYAYKRGFWPFWRGLLARPFLKSCGTRFFVGRGTKILFPKRLTAGRNVAIGDYVYLNCYGVEGVRIADNVRIKEFGWIQVTSHLSHPGVGMTVGPNTYIGPHCILGAAGGINVGADVVMGAYVQLLAENHNFESGDLPINRQGVTRRGIVVEDGCWLGNSVIVLDGVRIGSNSVIGAGSVVTHDIPQDSIAVGNPARVIRSRTPSPLSAERGGEE